MLVGKIVHYLEPNSSRCLAAMVTSREPLWLTVFRTDGRCYSRGGVRHWSTFPKQSTGEIVTLDSASWHDLDECRCEEY